MNRQVLDEDLTEQESLESYPGLKAWISIIVLWIGMGGCLLNDMLGNAEVDAALFLLIITTIITALHLKSGVKLTFVAILLGVFDLLTFFPMSQFIEFRGIQIEIDLILVVVLIIHLYTTYNIVSMFFKDMTKSKIKDEDLF